MRKLHPGAKLLFFIQYLFLLGIFIVPLLFGAFSSIVLSRAFGIDFFNMFIFCLIAVFCLIGFCYILAILSYNNWGYEFRKDNLYIKRGIIWKHYSSIPYERVQNVDIVRGVIARLVGFSCLRIQTAGYSGAVSAEGSLPALDEKEAEEYRDFLLKFIKGEKGGL